MPLLKLHLCEAGMEYSRICKNSSGITVDNKDTEKYLENEDYETNSGQLELPSFKS